jgi:hypothetical protein
MILSHDFVDAFLIFDTILTLMNCNRIRMLVCIQATAATVVATHMMTEVISMRTTGPVMVTGMRITMVVLAIRTLPEDDGKRTCPGRKRHHMIITVKGRHLSATY